MIASDSYNVQARRFDTIVLNAGERFDLIVETNHTFGDFWIRVRGLGICFIHKIESFALLRYVVETESNPDSDRNPVDHNNAKEQNSMEATDDSEPQSDESEQSEEFDYPLMPDFEEEYPRTAVKQDMFVNQYDQELIPEFFYTLLDSESSKCHMS